MWSDEDEGFIATSHELPGVSAFGTSRQEAADAFEEALKAAIASLKEGNRPLPSHASLPEFSGQFRVRIAASLHQRLSGQARLEGISLNSLVSSYLTEGIAQANAARFISSQVKKTTNELCIWMRTAQRSRLETASDNVFLARPRTLKDKIPNWGTDH